MILFRHILILSLCFIYSSTLNKLYAQKRTMVNERVTGFVIQKSDKQSFLPVSHGIEIEVSSWFPLDQTGENQVTISVYTDSWFLDPEKLNTFFLKDFQGVIKSLPGALSLGEPEFWLLEGSEERKRSYNPGNLTLQDINGHLLNEKGKQQVPYLHTTHPELILPFQIPACTDHQSRIRAFEMKIPIQVFNPNSRIEFVLDKVRLGSFSNSSGSYGDPMIEDLTFALSQGSNSRNESYQSSSNQSISPSFSCQAESSIDWILNCSIVEEGTDQFILHELSFQSSGVRYIGITKVELILMVPDGSLKVRDLPEIINTESITYVKKSNVPIFFAGASSICQNNKLQLASAWTLLKESGFHEAQAGLPMTYSELLHKIWTYETNWDYIRFPEYCSVRNYPLVENSGGIQIKLPVADLKGANLNSKVSFRIHYLSGNDKANLKNHQECLIFDL